MATEDFVVDLDVADSDTPIDYFGDDTDPANYYLTPALRQRIDLLHHLAEFGRQILLIKGAARSGKSSMINYLCSETNNDWVVINIVADENLTADRLLAHLFSKLKVNTRFESFNLSYRQDLTDELRVHLKSLDNNAQVVLLTIDDAEHLPTETQHLIVDLAHGPEPAIELRVILAANLENASLLQNLRLGPRDKGLVHIVEIPRFSIDQTRALIQHRMNSNQKDNDFPFDQRMIEEIQNESAGNPGQALSIARQATMIDDWDKVISEEKPSYNPKILRYSIAAGLALFAIIFLWQLIKPESSITETQTLELKSDQNLESTNTQASDGDSQIILPTKTDFLNDIDEAMPEWVNNEETKIADFATQPKQHGVDETQDKKTPRDEEPESITVKAVEDKNVDMDNEKVNAATVADPLVATETPPDTDIENTAEELPAAREEPSEDETPPDQQKTESPPPPTSDLAEKLPPTIESIEEIPVASKSVTEASSISIAPTLDSDDSAYKMAPKNRNFTAQWLLSRKKSGYVLQLFGVRKLESAKKFITLNQMENRSAIFETALQGRPWYVVVYGYYHDRKMALDAINIMPNKIKRFKPWARSIESLAALKPVI